MILENKKKEEEELHKLEWASRNEKRAHWNKDRSKGKQVKPSRLDGDLPKDGNAKCIGLIQALD